MLCCPPVMSDSPYTIIANSTQVWEQKIGTCGSEAEHCPGTTLQKQIELVSNTVVKGIRTVVMKRPFAGLTKVLNLTLTHGLNRHS